MRYRVTLTRPDGIEYAEDVKAPTTMQAHGQVEHNFTTKHPDIKLTELTAVRVVLIDADEVEGVPA